MRILHFNPFDDKTSVGQSISTYISMLQDNVGNDVDMETVTSLKDLKKSIYNHSPELLHLYGAWNWKNGMASLLATKKNIRYVYTPYGQLDPWVIHQHYIKHKLPRIILYQKKIVQRAYAVIASGNIEKEKLQELNWNTHLEVLFNPCITSSITHEEFYKKLKTIYQKVLNSRVRQIMKESTKQALSILIKASQIDDIRWINEQEKSIVRETGGNEWNKIAVYAMQEQIADTITKGCNLLCIHPPVMDANQLTCYSAQDISKKSVAAKRSILQIKKGANNQEIAEYFRAILELIKNKQISVRHLIDFSYLLRFASMEEDKLLQDIEEQKQKKKFQGLMYILAEYTSLEEGFMPIPGEYNGLSKKIQLLIN